MLLGYARVSSLAEDSGEQFDALATAGCERVFVDHAAGATSPRPELDRLLRECREGDAVVVWRLDRLAGSIQRLLCLAESLDRRRVRLRSLQDDIDAAGGNALRLLRSMAAFERELIRERTAPGLEAARARGARGGRPRVLDGRSQQLATDMRANGISVAEIAGTLKVSRATVYRCLTGAGELQSCR